MCDELHSIANSQNRYAKFEDVAVEFWGLGLSHAGRSARENYAFGVMLENVLRRGLGWKNNRKDMEFPNPSCNELRGLGAKIKNDNGIMVRMHRRTWCEEDRRFLKRNRVLVSPIIRGLLRNNHIMDMGFPETCRCEL